MLSFPSLCTLSLYTLLSWFTTSVASATASNDEIRIPIRIAFRNVSSVPTGVRLYHRVATSKVFLRDVCGGGDSYVDFLAAAGGARSRFYRRGVRYELHQAILAGPKSRT